MKGNEVIRQVLDREGVSSTQASILMDRKRAYLSSILSNSRDPHTSTMANFADAMGYELILRSRDDGFEFLIDE